VSQSRSGTQAAAFNERSEALRKRMLRPLGFRLYLLKALPLAAAAGLALERLDASACVVRLPGGWRTQNPFRSTYFAAQAMAAEMSTGAPALVLVRGAPASVAMIVREVRGVFTRKIQGESRFEFTALDGLRAAVERAAAGGDGETFVAHSTGRTADGGVAAEFDVTWSFKRRS
jgi:Domain of unknown function (DUF4442)